MSFPFRAIGFDWAYTLVDLGKEDDRKPLQKVFSLLDSKNIPVPDFEEYETGSEAKQLEVPR